MSNAVTNRKKFNAVLCVQAYCSGYDIGCQTTITLYLGNFVCNKNKYSLIVKSCSLRYDILLKGYSNVFFCRSRVNF